MNQAELQERLSTLEDTLIRTTYTADNRLYLECEAADSYEINRLLFTQCGLRFTIVTGIDSDRYFEVLYHYSNDETGCIVTVKALIRDRESPQIKSITPMIPGAEWIEREVHDLLGIDFEGHPNLRRLILADDWPQGVYPLRKEQKNEKVAH
ncbi:NADH-quinone oxidoreductase subunit C [Planctomycetota bacterium]